jgi:N-acetylglutamate synthase-like GNAT family acetyltransferase
VAQRRGGRWRSILMKQVVVRVALPNEQKELEALQWRASVGNPGDREALLANPEVISVSKEQISNGFVFVAHIEGAIVGFAGIASREDGNIELDALFVEPDAWRRGIGRSLVNYCVQVAKGKGSSAIHVMGNPHAEGFYRSCGFQAFGTTQTRFGTALLMYKPL